jgi:hypothetical protein
VRFLDTNFKQPSGKIIPPQNFSYITLLPQRNVKVIYEKQKSAYFIRELSSGHQRVGLKYNFFYSLKRKPSFENYKTQHNCLVSKILNDTNDISNKNLAKALTFVFHR